MNKLLTTGEMIDTLQVGEVAETQEGFKVTKRSSGAITWIHDGDDSHNYLKINIVALDFKWRILPRYVSLDEAMEAFYEGKTITIGAFSFCISDPHSLGGLELTEIHSSNWTVESE